MKDTHLILYDGVCGLCNRMNRFVLKWDGEEHFRFAPLQGVHAREALQRYGRDPADLDTFYVLAHLGTPQEQLLARSRAGLFVLKSVGGPWRLLCAFGILPTVVLDFFYGLIARSRYRLFGRFEACPTPDPRYQDRFLLP